MPAPTEADFLRYVNLLICRNISIIEDATMTNWGECRWDQVNDKGVPTIALKPGLAAPSRVYVLIHETAHSLLHIPPANTLPKELMEFEASLVARMVYSRLGHGPAPYDKEGHTYHSHDVLNSKSNELIMEHCNFTADIIYGWMSEGQ